MNKTYIYKGPMSSATLRLPDGSQMDVIFSPNREVSLPSEHPYVQTLVAQKRLVLVEKPVKTLEKKGEK